MCCGLGRFTDFTAQAGLSHCLNRLAHKLLVQACPEEGVYVLMPWADYGLKHLSGSQAIHSPCFTKPFLVFHQKTRKGLVKQAICVSGCMSRPRPSRLIPNARSQTVAYPYHPLGYRICELGVGIVMWVGCIPGSRTQDPGIRDL